MNNGMTVFEKFDALKARLSALSGLAVAFSGGVDSTLLIKAAHEALGERTVALTARSRNFPEREFVEAREFCEAIGVRHIVVDVDELAIEGFAANPPDRCYICKNALLDSFRAEADSLGIEHIAEGTNFDDDVADRPGFRAVTERGILSPLREAQLSKAEIRELLRGFNLAVAEKPSLACLASRFPYGETITREKLAQVDAAELIVFGLGIRQARVRHHGSIARIETDEDGFRIFADREVRARITAQLRELGFTYVALDMLGYRTGSMSEGL